MQWRPHAVFVQGGVSARESDVAGIGLRWPAPWPPRDWGGAWSGAVEATVSHWWARPRGALENSTQWSVVPLIRWRPQEGRSAWFVEAGAGLSLHDIHYRRARSATQATRWNFQEVIAVGVNPAPGHELSLRLAHISNANIRRPNPGEDWLTLRWSFSL